jgi:hypothetical protein
MKLPLIIDVLSKTKKNKWLYWRNNSTLNKLRETEGMNSSVIHNTSSVKREWFINLNPAFLNRDRLHFVKGVLAHIKRRSKGIPGFTEGNTKDKECYQYKLHSTKFCKNKIFVTRRLKKYDDAYDKIKEVAIQNNNARIIQCYFRSYLHFRDFCKDTSFEL